MISHLSELGLFDDDDDGDERSLVQRVFEAERRTEMRGPHAFVWTREEALKGRQRERGTEQSAASVSSSSSSSSSVRELYRGARSRTSDSISEQKFVAKEYDEEAESLLALDELLVELDTAGLQPYTTALSIQDKTGTIEPLHVLRTVLTDLRNLQHMANHAVLHERLRTHLSRKQRNELLRTLNRIQLFEQSSIEYMRGCRRCPIDTLRVQRGTYPLARVLYWICSSRFGKDQLDEKKDSIAGRFVISNHCGTERCVNPQHYTHSFKRNRVAEAEPLEWTDDEFLPLEDDPKKPQTSGRLLVDQLFEEALHAK